LITARPLKAYEEKEPTVLSIVQKAVTPPSIYGVARANVSAE
jgi:hypothetical protein